VEVGLTLPSMIAGLDRAGVLEWCRRVDGGPFSTLAIGERIAYPNTELMVSLSVAAAVTERVRLMSTVIILPMHPAVEIAKQAATLDVLSDGRVVLGVGVGGRDEDYRALEATFDRRHQRLDEQVALMQRVWAGEPPFPDMAPVGPPPVQVGGPPLYSGALGPKAIARSARWAAGICGFVLDPLGEDHRATFGRIEDAWSAAGRTERPRHVTSFWYSTGEGPGAGAQEHLRRYAEGYLGVFGAEAASMMAELTTAWSGERVVDAMGRLAEAGCDEQLLVPTSADPEEVDGAAELVAAFSG
jgi:alkanesulfonate monooxygenase SsuD/methylene tetrahydromethanopterin reductase-like flavin-dependent oxidoreductase (luciferase family)